MRKFDFTPGEVYHVYNRGVLKRKIFIDPRDWIRFLFVILHFQSERIIYNLSNHVNHYVRHSMFNIGVNKLDIIDKNRLVKLHNFSLLPNHFHLLLEEVEEGGISKYMQRVSNAYTKYFNIKYKESGHLFQNRFQAVHIEDNEQLLYTSAYIHLNCRDNKKWLNKEHLYPWSSYQDYLQNNRWNNLLTTDLILDQFDDPKDYQETVESSNVKVD